MSVGAVNKNTGERIPTAGMPAIDSVLSGTSTNPVQNRVVKAALDDKADTDIVASDFDATASYTAGNYCVYEGKFYRFKTTHSGAWAAADVDEIKIAGELSSLMSGLTKKVEIITTGTFNALKVMRCADVESISVEYGSPTVDMAANTLVDVAVAPAIYRPSTERYLSTYVVGASGQAICSARVSIKPDGTIRFSPGALIAKDTPIFWLVTFII